jgi:hypothetical protein
MTQSVWLDIDMPAHEASEESVWLEENYASLEEYAGEWVAVRGSDVVGHDVDPVRLANGVNADFGPAGALFAFVLTEPHA